MLPGESARRWMFSVWRWLLGGLGGFDAFRSTELLALDDTFFPVDPLEGHELAEDYLGFVCEHAGLTDSPVLVPELATMSGGAFGVGPGAEAIAYRPQWIEDEELLVAELAIAASAQRLDAIEEVGPTPVALLAEVGAIYLGFGTVIANTVAQRRHPATAGPVETRRLTLGEREAAYGLAIFCWLSEIPDARALSQLSANPAAFYRTAVRELRSRGSALDRLRAMRRPVRGPYR